MQRLNNMICIPNIHILAKCIPFTVASISIHHKVESFQLTKGEEHLLHLVLCPVTREATNKELVGGVGNDCADNLHTGEIHAG